MKPNNPGNLTLRPFLDSDITLMEKWLAVPHVAKWYLHPDHWLHELHNRRGEYSFITHFIVEYENVPIGFCQYYDCYFSQAHEVWNDTWNIAEHKGEIFSLDYLIGEVDYLHCGFGKKILFQLLEKLRETGAATIIVQPDKENTASCRLLESCGFQYYGDEYVFELKGK